MEGLSGALYSNCAKHSSARDVLVLQDTSEVNLNHLLGKLSIQDNDIGVLTSSDSFGFFLHPSLVLDAHTAFPLGFSALHIWNRALEHYDKVQRNYKNLAIEDKEPYRWLESAQKSKAQGKAIKKLCLMALPAAWELLQLKKDRLGQAGERASILFSKPEIACLEALIPDLEGKTKLQQNSYAKYTLAWAIARLGD